MSLEDDYPALTAMLDGHFRALGDGDRAAVEAFVAEVGEAGREEVLDELRQLAATQHDPDELRSYLMIHRFDMLPDGGAEVFFQDLTDLLERGFW